MNRKSFLKTGILGLICGLFSGELFAAKNIKTNDTTDKIFKTNYLFRLSLCCLGEAETQKQIDDGKKIGKEISNSSYFRVGNLENLIKEHHNDILILMAKVIAEYDNNKHLNLDMMELYKQFREKYKITNI